MGKYSISELLQLAMEEVKNSDKCLLMMEYDNNPTEFIIEKVEEPNKGEYNLIVSTNTLIKIYHGKKFKLYDFRINHIVIPEHIANGTNFIDSNNFLNFPIAFSRVEDLTSLNH